MSKLDSIIRGGRVANASDTVASSADVGVHRSKIMALGEDLGTAETRWGMRRGKAGACRADIDSHVHLSHAEQGQHRHRRRLRERRRAQPPSAVARS